jgi:hypothetical protein
MTTIQLVRSFPLIKNTKVPAVRWLTYKTKERIVGNAGIRTGKKTGITVVDLDFYTKGEKIYDSNNCLFTQTFGSEFIKRFNTLTVKTPSGGMHLYFQYDEEIRTTTCEKHRVDIRSNGGYIVAPGSKINGVCYEIVNQNTITKMPEDLRTWLLSNIYKPKKVYHNIKRKGGGTDYNYNFSDKELMTIFKKLDKKYWVNYQDFLIFTTACKVLDCEDVWDEINSTKPGYDQDGNDKIWEGAKESHIYTVNHILKEVGMLESLNYYKYKPVLANIIKPDLIMKKDKLKYTFLNKGCNYVIKSDTGTGKTTCFKHYIYNNNLNFISIVSRVSLGFDQYQTFAKHGIELKYYGFETSFRTGDNVVITIDGISKLYAMDLSNYVIFLDEFNSTIEYLITSSTLNEKRYSIYCQFIDKISQCKQIVCVDADITDISLRFLEFTSKRVKYIHNTHKHNKGVNAKEIFSHKNFISQLKKEDAFIVCCDSMNQAQLIYKELNDPDVILITRDTKIIPHLDDHKKIIFSPKIVFGMDSSMIRPVYCYYREGTITPTAMLQQIGRARHMTCLKYLFTKKSFDDKKIDHDFCLKKVQDEIVSKNISACQYFVSMGDKIKTEQYLELLAKYTYNYSCYSINKFAHFIKLIDTRGFISVTRQFKKTKVKDLKKKLRELKKDKIKNFDPESPAVKDINKYLKIPKDMIEDYKVLFIDPIKLKQHFNITKILSCDKDYLLEAIKELKEFNINKIVSIKMKIYFLMILKDKAGCLDFYDVTVINDLNNNEGIELFKLYNCIFGNKSTKDFTIKTSVEYFIRKIYNELFGNLFKSKRRRQNDKQLQYYIVNCDKVKFHTDLIHRRNIKTISNPEICALLDGL